MVCIYYYPEATNKARFRFDPLKKGLLAVWDVEKGARRFINLDGVESIKLSGRRLEPKERPVGSAPGVRRAADCKPKRLETSWENLEAANLEIEYLFG